MDEDAYQLQTRNSKGARFMLAVIVALCAVGLVWSFWPEDTGRGDRIAAPEESGAIGDRSFQEALGAAEESAEEGAEAPAGEEGEGADEEEASDVPEPPA
ncbi:hypothetical protein DDZ18_09280 [Marinicauda salina]|uniref:Uncharacterized protein n=1 Tax=Marinicauda salina TaxID=2135793 RepID=A0A2U2BS99_9PROT|nr:hypothetical protein [Marinicauda salina]PWE16897.1 hypothetical protein DDZ18_09280 [Marinicauda salina]